MAWSKKKDDSLSAIIRQMVEISGKMAFEGLVRLDGQFTGEIHSTGTLVIGESAKISAEIYVDTVVVSGELVGNIYAKNRVHLNAPAKVTGNISTVHLVIDDGVLFEGQSQRYVAEELPLPLPDESSAEKNLIDS